MKRVINMQRRIASNILPVIFFFFLNAHAFLQSGTIRAHETTDIAVIFTANAAGQLLECSCGREQVVGGFSRCASVVDSLRLLYPNAVLVDAGDLFSSFVRTENDAILASIIARMRYDGIAVGEYEYVGGAASLRARLAAGLPFVNANLELNAAVPPFLSFERGGKVYSIVGLTSEKGFRHYEKRRRPAGLRMVPAEFPALFSRLAARSDVFITLAHGDQQFVDEIAAQVPVGSLVIQGHWHRTFVPEKDGVRTIGEVTVVNPGSSGDFVGLALKSEQRGSWQIKHIWLTDAISKNTTIEKIIESKK